MKVTSAENEWRRYAPPSGDRHYSVSPRPAGELYTSGHRPAGRNHHCSPTNGHQWSPMGDHHRLPVTEPRPKLTDSPVFSESELLNGNGQRSVGREGGWCEQSVTLHLSGDGFPA